MHIFRLYSKLFDRGVHYDSTTGCPEVTVTITSHQLNKNLFDLDIDQIYFLN